MNAEKSLKSPWHSANEERPTRLPIVHIWYHGTRVDAVTTHEDVPLAEELGDINFLPDDKWAYVDDLLKAQIFPDCGAKSPFTGGTVTIHTREEEVTFRGEKIKVNRQYYRCEDTGREFTDSNLDDDMMWTVFRKYCEKKGIESFKDIVLPQEQPEVDLAKFTEKIGSFKERYKNNPELVSIKGAMAFMARMFYQYPAVAREWYENLPKATMD